MNKKKNCIICNNNKFVIAFPFNTFFNSKFFLYKKCIKCSFVKISPNPNSKDLNKMYDNKNYHKEFYTHPEHNEYEASAIYLGKYIKSNSIILDYGCGYGHFIKKIPKKHTFYGVEYNSGVVNVLKKKNKKANFLTVQNFKKKKLIFFFDIICLGDVLEHVTDPIDLLLDLDKNIKKGGLFFIEGPIERNISLVNYFAIIFGCLKKFFIRDYKNTFIPYHLYFCDINTQTLMLEKLKNYKIIDIQVYESGWPYYSGGIIKKIIAYIAILISKANFLGFKFGNRFRIILKKDES